MIVKNIFDLSLIPEAIHGGNGLCPHASVFKQEELQSPIRFVNYTVLPAGADFGAHKHGDDNEFYFVIEGEGAYTSDGETVSVKAGSLMLNAPFATHSIKNTGSGELKLLVFEAYNQ